MSEAKRFPTNRELFAWFIMDAINSSARDLDTIEGVYEMIDEYERTPALEVHDDMYSSYSEFADEFLSPDAFVSSNDEDDPSETASAEREEAEAVAESVDLGEVDLDPDYDEDDEDDEDDE